MSLKQNLKKILTEKQIRNYEKQLDTLKVTYDVWIRKQEAKLQIDDILVESVSKCQNTAGKNDCDEGKKFKNEGEAAKMVRFGSEWLLQSKSTPAAEKVRVVCVPMWNGCNAENETIENPVGFDEQFWRKVESFARSTNKTANNETNVILFVLNDGLLSDICLPLLYQAILAHPEAKLWYGDEDVQPGKFAESGASGECAKSVASGVSGQRLLPWLKPDWSPDTFLSYFYMGSLVAVDADTFLDALQTVSSYEVKASVADVKEAAADVKEAAAEKKNTLYLILYEVLKKQETAKMQSQQDARLHQQLQFLTQAHFLSETVVHIPEILYHTKEEGYAGVKQMSLPKTHRSFFPESGRIASADQIGIATGKNMVSIIIPSKDNPDVLMTCLRSCLRLTKDGPAYEILIIDNGSSDVNKQRISEEVKCFTADTNGTGCLSVKYHYEPMPFNFSKMCNLGASLANGNLLLFLNDDMEILQEDWLQKLTEKALLPYAGAVGAKLLYPDSDIIQHAGITNLRVGPAHKLQFLSDTEDRYYGKNRYVHDVLAVTGACLMIRKELFTQAGGFYEGLAVAFNDVDLCYTVIELGFNNIIRNDVILYHHESLSRGKDGESEEKQLRLLKEKDILYERHQSIYGKDPYYHKYLTSDMLESGYTPAFHYQVDLNMPFARVSRYHLKGNIREDACLRLGMECATDLFKWKYGISVSKSKKKPKDEELGYYFQGYSFIIGSDNACYKKTLLLQNKDSGEFLAVPVETCYRPDIDRNLTDQIHTALTGFAARVALSDIPKGKYRFAMLAEDRCSRQKLLSYSSWVLNTEEEQVWFDEVRSFEKSEV